MSVIEINSILLTPPVIEKQTPDNRVEADFIMRDARGEFQITVNADRGYSANLIIRQTEKGVVAVIENDYRIETIVPLISWEDDDPDVEPIEQVNG